MVVEFDRLGIFDNGLIEIPLVVLSISFFQRLLESGRGTGPSGEARWRW